MAKEATEIRRTLCALRRQLRSDLREMAEEVLQQSLGAGRDNVQASIDGGNLDVEHLRTELALRTMASRYALLSRIDKALDPPGSVPCASSGCDGAQRAPPPRPGV